MIKRRTAMDHAIYDFRAKLLYRSDIDDAELYGFNVDRDALYGKFVRSSVIYGEGIRKDLLYRFDALLYETPA